MSGLKADLRAGIAALDTAIQDNAATFNSWFPQPIRGALDSQQKSHMLARVMQRRADLGL